MTRATLSVVVLACGIAVACGGDSHAPLVGALGNGGFSPGGAPSSGGRGSAGRADSGGLDAGGSRDDAGTRDAGEDADARGAGGTDAGGSGNRGGRIGSGGSSGAGGSGAGGPVGQGGTDGGAGPAGDALCESELDDPVKAFGPVGPAGASTFARFGAVSADELSVVWTSSGGDVYVGARAKNPGVFDAGTRISASALAVDRAAMDPTGLVVLAVAKDRASLVEFRRLNRSDPFSPAAGDELSRVRAFLGEGGAVSEPVLGGDKLSLFFLATKAGRAPKLHESKWAAAEGLWGEPAQVTNSELASADSAHVVRPTGGSADGRTLFFYDGAEAVERAAFRNSPSAPFDTFIDVGAFPDAAPNTRCDTFYYSGSDAGGSGLFTAG